ncbi:MAG: hypothetical protein AAFP08_00260 [Bacteroidota bacterium]
MTPSEIAACPDEQVLIDYLFDRLLERDRFQLEEHLLDCPLCAETIEALRSVGQPEAGELMELETRVLSATVGVDQALKLSTEGEQKHRGQSISVLSSTLNSMRPILAVAASVVLLLGLFGWYRSQTTEQRLFAEYFNPLPRYGYVSVRSLGNTSGADFLAAALQAQSQGDYERSISSWNAYLQSETDDVDYRPNLYLALAQIEVGRLEEAAENLAELPPDFSSEISEEALWYRALLDIRLDNSADAKSKLQNLFNQGQTIYADLAGELLKKL